MTIEEALFNHLTTDTSITTIVEGRIYPTVAIQRQKTPHIVYTAISTLHHESMEGSSGLAAKRFQIDSISEVYATAKQVSELVRLRLQGFIGLMGTMIDKVRVDLVEADDTRDGYNDDMELYVCQSDFIVHYEEQIPGDP